MTLGELITTLIKLRDKAGSDIEVLVGDADGWCADIKPNWITYDSGQRKPGYQLVPPSVTILTEDPETLE